MTGGEGIGCEGGVSEWLGGRDAGESEEDVLGSVGVVMLNVDASIA